MVFARIEVVMSNDGENAYKPDEYGAYIMIIRTITKSLSTFHMEGELKRRKTVTKKELCRYLRHAKINIQNPVTYMNQESSKSFFFNCSPENFYRYYYGASGLDEMEACIINEKQNLEECKQELKIRKSILGPDRENLKELQGQISIFEQKLQEWKSAKDMYKMAVHHEALQKFQKLEQKRDNVVSNDPDRVIKEHETKIATLANQALQHKAEIDKLFNATMALKEKKRSISDSLSNVAERIEDLKSSMATSLQQDQAQENEPIEEPMGVRLKKELAKCQQQAQEAAKLVEKYTSNAATVQASLKDLEQRLNDAQDYLKDIKIETEKQDTTRHQNVYKYSPEKVHAEIEYMRSRCNLFQHRPIGPVGDYIVIRANVENWRIACIMERHLQRILFVWLVATEEDRQALAKLLLKHGCQKDKINIIKTNLYSKTLDIVSQTERQLDQQGLEMVLYRFLEISAIPTILLHVLIDSFNIAQILVVQNHQELLKALDDDSLNILGAYTLSNLDFGKRINGSKFLSPNDCKNPFKYRIVRFATESTETKNHQVPQVVEENREELEKIVATSRKEIEHAKAAHAQIIAQLENAISTRTRWLRKCAQLEADLDAETRGLVYKENENDHGDQQDMESESFQETLNKYLEQRLEQQEELVKVQSELEQMLGLLSQAKVNRHSVSTQSSKLKSTIQSLKKQKNSHITKIKAAQQEYEKAKDAMEKSQLDLQRDGIVYEEDKILKTPQEYLQLAEVSKELLQRCVVGSKGVEEYLKELKQRRDLRQEQLEIKEQKLNETFENFNIQKQNFARRCQRFEECRRRIEKVAKRAFRKVLDSVTGYDGSLVFNDVERTLAIQVHNKQQAYDRKYVATNVKTLSGGEQSSIQLSLLQSLAVITFTPLHMFDEIDVYMDSSTRLKNIESLVNFANMHQDRQVFLVTPHAEFAKILAESHPNLVKVFNVGQYRP
ncbi:bifunctional P-loop containing nucleoside triphosphate hydrolase/Structural maintenance of chromosomes protein 6 [Babesia duncani]|uniref:Bifunctional P-loop containing nucleoside triphosphate hydrolase/Structural maintenance of chromosomes protein 6 n=1 Tax=Babesia duncani TaxID=323732 RepID=A0AAD9PLP1_9APIC|nr:bifunctional P-loop containing nucleoside triphosphate hydrolase/Structural maintenance of chromosomes protein 6 [Babesia duncani]